MLSLELNPRLITIRACVCVQCHYLWSKVKWKVMTLCGASDREIRRYVVPRRHAGGKEYFSASGSSRRFQLNPANFGSHHSRHQAVEL
jgi:hypothetical protein